MTPPAHPPVDLAAARGPHTLKRARENRKIRQAFAQPRCENQSMDQASAAVTFAGEKPEVTT